MEREKQEKKENILKITKQLQEVGKTSYRELEDQGVQLKQTHRDVKAISGHITGIDRDLGEIQANRKGRGGLLGCLCLICCCAYCCGLCRSKKPVVKSQSMPPVGSATLARVPSDEHLPDDRIEREWCMRYDPEERWIKQVELGNSVCSSNSFQSSNYLISPPTDSSAGLRRVRACRCHRRRSYQLGCY